MYFANYMKQFENKKVKLFVDMDGVIADYNVGDPAHYDEKRPLYSNLSQLEEISHHKNVTLYILSASRMHEGIEQKNNWLDQYAPFFEKERRIIIAREDNNFAKSKDLKCEYLKTIPKDDSIIVIIDDDPAVLKLLSENYPHFILLKDTVLID